jgi:hypothetical protein
MRELPVLTYDLSATCCHSSCLRLSLWDSRVAADSRQDSLEGENLRGGPVPGRRFAGMCTPRRGAFHRLLRQSDLLNRSVDPSPQQCLSVPLAGEAGRPGLQPRALLPGHHRHLPWRQQGLGRGGRGSAADPGDGAHPRPDEARAGVPPEGGLGEGYVGAAQAQCHPTQDGAWQAGQSPAFLFAVGDRGLGTASRSGTGDPELAGHGTVTFKDCVPFF